MWAAICFKIPCWSSRKTKGFNRKSLWIISNKSIYWAYPSAIKHGKGKPSLSMEEFKNKRTQWRIFQLTSQIWLLGCNLVKLSPSSGIVGSIMINSNSTRNQTWQLYNYPSFSSMIFAKKIIFSLVAFPASRQFHGPEIHGICENWIQNLWTNKWSIPIYRCY